MATFFLRFEEKQIKKADEANKITILSFSILVRTIIVLLFSCVHIKTSTLTATGLQATSRQDANCKAAFKTQTPCDR